jgi:Carboxypeptidase regulatory-like domain
MDCSIKEGGFMKRAFIFGLLACALAVSFVQAQVNTGDIIGNVRMADGSAIPGVTVTLTGNVTGALNAITSTEGNYRFSKLAPGVYDLNFSLKGFKTVDQRQIRISVGVTTTVNAEMEPGAIEEEVTVVGQKTMINTRQTTVATTVTREVMDQLPLGRGYLTVVNMAPGILSEAQGGGVTGGSGLVYGPGTEAYKNSWAVDGAAVDGRFYPGESGISISRNQLEETQVSISSHDIMNIAGGVQVNFVSKRGGNRYSGDLFIELMDNKFEMNQTLPDAMKAKGWIPAGVNRIWDYAASLGGPLWKDHLWFFGSGSISDPQTRSYTNSVTRPTFTGNYYAKLNAQYKNTTAQFSYNWSGSDTLNVPISNYTTATQNVTSPTRLYTAELQHVTGNFLITAKYTFAKSEYSLHAGDKGWNPDKPTYADGRRISFYHRAWTYNYAQSAPKSALPPISMMLAQDEVGKRPYFVAYGDYFKENLLGGDHEFKLGYDYANNKMNREQLLPNGLSIYVNQKDASFVWPADPSNGLVAGNYYPGVAKWFYYRDDIINYIYTKRQGIFFQDTAVYHKLTATLGLRWDQHSWGWSPFVVGQFNPWNGTLAGGPYTGDDGAWKPWTVGLTVDAGSVPVKPNALSPRISLTYDLTGDGKNIIKASYAYYQGILSNLYNSGIAPGANRIIYTPFFDYNNDNWPDEGEFYRYTLGQIDLIKATKTAPGWSYYNYAGALSPTEPVSAKTPPNVYDPDWKTPGVQEIVLGFEKQLMENLSVGINGYHKQESRSTVTYRAEGTLSSYKVQWPWEVEWVKVATDPVTGNDVYSAKQRPPTQLNFFTHDRNNWTNYYGLELIVHKRLANRWMFNGSFNYQDYNKHLNEPENNPSNWYYFNNAAADPASYRSGLIFFNSRWMVKLNGLYVLPYGFTVSGTLVANEGNPIYNGRNIVSNVTLYPKDEQYGDVRQPNIVQVNLALEKRIDLGESASLTLEARVFNVFNNSTIIRVGQFQVPQQQVPDTIIAPGIAQFGVRMSWR